jgi:hypothetical protein
MSTGTSLHADQASRLLLKKREQLASTELATHENMTILIDSVDLENALRKVDTDRDKLRHQWLLSSGRQHPNYASTRRREQEPSTPSIEMAFAKLKALPRKAAERTVDGLWNAIGRLVDIFTPEECANYFAAAGYDPD